MHPSALQLGGAFLNAYAREGARVVDLGAYDVNGSLRSVCPPTMTYIGVDMEAGPGVDLVVEPGQPLALPDGYADLVVSSSAFEHDDAFWVTFLDLVRITKPGGFIYMNVPSNGHVHRHPGDCWRFYPDAGRALERWARRQGRPVTLIESFVGERRGGFWNDFVAVFGTGEREGAEGLAFLSDAWPSSNVRRLGHEDVLRPRQLTEDMLLIERAAKELRRAESSGFQLGDPDLPDLLAPRDTAPLAVAQPAFALGPALPPVFMHGVIDQVDGLAPEPVVVVHRARPSVMSGWIVADGFDPTQPEAKRYLAFRQEDGSGKTYLADLGSASKRPDVAMALPQLNDRFSELAGFSRSVDLSGLPAGRYQLGFVLTDARGARARMISTRLHLG